MILDSHFLGIGDSSEVSIFGIKVQSQITISDTIQWKEDYVELIQN